MVRLKEIRDRIEAAYKQNANVPFGPGHAVFDDWNLEQEHIDIALATTIDSLKTGVYRERAIDQNDRNMLTITEELLRWLSAIPEDERVPPELTGDGCYCPDCRPELYLK